MRDRIEKTDNPSIKTLSTAVVISAFVMVAALIYIIYSGDETLKEMIPADNLVVFKTSLGIVLGLGALLSATFGMLGLTHSWDNKYQRYAVFSSLGITLTLIASGVLTIIFYKNYPIGISFLGIGICIVVLCLISSPLKILREKRKNEPLQ